MICNGYYIHFKLWEHLVQADKLKKKKKKNRKLKYIESSSPGHIINFCCFPFHVRWRYQREVGDSDGLLKDVAKKKLHDLIILLKLPMKWICFCLQGFLSKKMPKSHSYLAFGAREVLLKEVQQVLSWCGHVLNLCTMLTITNQ